MKYSELLSKYIEESGLSLGEISIRLSNKNIKVDRSYISKLKNDNKPPASEEVTRALAEVTGGDVDALLLAGYIEKAPEEIKPYLTEAANTGELFDLFGSLVMYVENFRSTGTVDEELLRKIEISKRVFANVYKYFLSTEPLEAHPEYAVTLIARLKQHFLPMTDSISFRGVTINFSDYLTKDGEPKFQENPYPQMVENAHNLWLSEKNAVYTATPNISYIDEVLGDQVKEKLNFFDELERDLGLDLNDPEVQKKLKRAAKIIFSDED